MSGHKLPCGHLILRPSCTHCKELLKKWYLKICEADPTWRDIEYGLDSPKLLYQPVDLDTINPLTTAYYDDVWQVYHLWTKEGRSRRDQLVAELFAKQEKDSGTERGIAAVLRSKKLKPNSRFTVRQTIKEIDTLVQEIAQGRLRVEQAPIALRLKDSKPAKEDSNGQGNQADQRTSSRAA